MALGLNNDMFTWMEVDGVGEPTKELLEGKIDKSKDGGTGDLQTL